jgi:hypothetical protein
MDNRQFRRWVGSPWSRGGACASLLAFLSLGCRPEPIQQRPSQETPAERIKAQERAYQARFDEQPPDEGAKKKAQERWTHLALGLEGTQVHQLECHRTICRLETRHANDAAFQKFVRSSFMDVRTAWRGSFAVVRVDRAAASGDPAKQADGPVTALVFLGEERPDWPTIPEPPAKGAAQGESPPSPKPEKP